MQGKLWIGLMFACGTAPATKLAFPSKQRGALTAPGGDSEA